MDNIEKDFMRYFGKHFKELRDMKLYDACYKSWKASKDEYEDKIQEHNYGVLSNNKCRKCNSDDWQYHSHGREKWCNVCGEKD